MAKKTRDLTADEIGVGEDALIDFQFAALDAMREKGITKVQLADMLGISRARVSQMFSSDANLTIKLVGRTLDALGLETRYQSKDGKSAAEDASSHDMSMEEFAAAFSRRRIVAASWSWEPKICANTNGVETRKAA
ncbi:helix-turn-helix domain-containing protein [Rhizobium rhizogenes]|uniref:helix-turn-helix domain-containing protein n=1 Tax=Rhizobium rhizogenes TaxID=359 RepID=UPI003ECD25B9